MKKQIINNYRFLLNIIFAVSTFFTLKGEIPTVLNTLIGFLAIFYFIYSVTLNLTLKNKIGAFCDILSVYAISLFIIFTFHRWETLDLVISITTIVTFLSLLYFLFTKREVFKFDISMLVSTIIVLTLKFV